MAFNVDKQVTNTTISGYGKYSGDRIEIRRWYGNEFENDIDLEVSSKNDGSSSITLTPEQAKELMGFLNQMFAEK
jgi:hypothetical protein